MAESARESESNDEGSTSVMSTEFTSEFLKSEFSCVTFNNVCDCYPPDRDIECRYTIKSSIKPNSWDWIGLFPVGWQSSREHYTYEWSPTPSIQDGEQGRPIANRVVFPLRYLPKADDEFYQFCYVTYAGDVRGASAPFQMKTKPIDELDTELEELDCYEIEDDELGTLIMIVKNKVEISEESLARALEENACFEASNETALADLANANDKVLEPESRKADLMAALIECEKEASNLGQALAQKNLALEEEQNKRGRALEEEKKALNIEKSLVLQKSDEKGNINTASSADQHGSANPRDHAHDVNRLLLPEPPQGLQEHENFPFEMLAFPETWQTWNGKPVRFCTERNTNPRLVVYGTRSWYEKSENDTSQTDQTNMKQTKFQTYVLQRKVNDPDPQSCSPQA